MRFRPWLDRFRLSRQVDKPHQKPDLASPDGATDEDR
jgi:hypothetical protein